MDTIAIFGAKYLVWVELALAAWLFWRLPSEAKKGIAKLALGALPLAYVVALALGALYYDARPFVVGGFAPLIPHAADNGFPSDHALLAGAVASVFLFFDRKGSAALWVVAALVAISRVAVGVHHPIDVIGSFAIALAAAYAVRFALSRFKKAPSRETV